jgi:hypothetical protein
VVISFIIWQVQLYTNMLSLKWGPPEHICLSAWTINKRSPYLNTSWNMVAWVLRLSPARVFSLRVYKDACKFSLTYAWSLYEIKSSCNWSRSSSALFSSTRSCSSHEIKSMRSSSKSSWRSRLCSLDDLLRWLSSWTSHARPFLIGLACWSAHLRLRVAWYGMQVCVIV